MELSPDELRSRLDSVAGAAGGSGPDRARIAQRADHLRRRRRAGAVGAVAVVVLLAVGVAAWPRDSDVSVVADATTTITTTTEVGELGTETLLRRATALGELVVTVGPATQPWQFNPDGPTDRWREPASCYPPRLSVELGGRRTTVGVTSTDEPLLLPVVLHDVDDEAVAVAVVIVFGAHDDARYRLTNPDGTDESDAAGGVAVLVRPGELRPSEADAQPWSDFPIAEVAPDGTTRDLAVDMAAAENAFFAGDVNQCPDHTGVTPRPTVPAPPDVADAIAAAARAFDPSAPRGDALTLLGGDPATDTQLTALHERLAQQASALGQRALRILPDDRSAPVFHSTRDGWVLLLLVGDELPTGMTAWARVTRSAEGWRIDPRTICEAWSAFALTDVTARCAAEQGSAPGSIVSAPVGGIGPRGADAVALNIFGVAARNGGFEVPLATPRPSNAAEVLAALQARFESMQRDPIDGHRSTVMRSSDDATESTRFLSADDARVALVVRRDDGEVVHGPWWVSVRRIDDQWRVTGASLCPIAEDLSLAVSCSD